MPTCTLGGLRMPSMVRTPSLALSRSVQVPSGATGWHIAPARSIAITRSTGVDEHGLQALACADTSKWSMPNRRANQAFVLALPLTTVAFGVTDGLQPAATTEVFVHFAVNWKSKLARFCGLLASPYSSAVAHARVALAETLACGRRRIPGPSRTRVWRWADPGRLRARPHRLRSATGVWRSRRSRRQSKRRKCREMPQVQSPREAA